MFPLSLTVVRGASLLARASHPDGGLPQFYVSVLKDPLSTGIHSVQMIKGWHENGEQRELVQDIACGGNVTPDPETRRCPAPAASVNLDTCEVSGDDGSAAVEVLWTDESFQPEQRAFYYMRVLQSPSCRWSSYDAIRLDAQPVAEVPPVIKERAWSSPIWYSPARPLAGLRGDADAY